MAFFADGNRISQHEFHKALYDLKESAGFSDHQINKVRSTFGGDLEEGGFGKGISQHEFKKGIERLKEEHMGEHRFDNSHFDHIEKTFGRYL
ncbi:MAG: hypothetical protein V4467_03105 [Patescibacteria group bacterium]